jgi:hypothetical protein
MGTSKAEFNAHCSEYQNAWNYAQNVLMCKSIKQYFVLVTSRVKYMGHRNNRYESSTTLTSIPRNNNSSSSCATSVWFCASNNVFPCLHQVPSSSHTRNTRAVIVCWRTNVLHTSITPSRFPHNIHPRIIHISKQNLRHVTSQINESKNVKEQTFQLARV